jgi:hypothetical protein
MEGSIEQNVDACKQFELSPLRGFLEAALNTSNPEFLPLRLILQDTFPNPKSRTVIENSDIQKFRQLLREGAIDTVARFANPSFYVRIPSTFWERVTIDDMSQVKIVSEDQYRQGDFEIHLYQALEWQSEEDNLRVATLLANRRPGGLDGETLSALVQGTMVSGQVGALSSHWAINTLNPKVHRDDDIAIVYGGTRGRPPSEGWKIAFCELIRAIRSDEIDFSNDSARKTATIIHDRVTKRIAVTTRRKSETLSEKTLRDEIAAAFTDLSVPDISLAAAEKKLR